MILNRFAFLVSRIFDFYFWSPVMLLVTIFNTGLAGEQIKVLLPVILGLDVILPILLFFLALKRGNISDIDVTLRKERYKLFGGMTFILAISVLISFIFANNLFFVLSLISLLVALTLYLITLRYKISGHMIMNTGSILIINYLFNWEFLWLFLILPIVGFSRIYLKKHTLIQVLTGATIGFFEPLLILWLFGLL